MALAAWVVSRYIDHTTLKSGIVLKIRPNLIHGRMSLSNVLRWNRISPRLMLLPDIRLHVIVTRVRLCICSRFRLWSSLTLKVPRFRWPILFVSTSKVNAAI